jgi:Tol biopolymer transport system component
MRTTHALVALFVVSLSATLTTNAQSRKGTGFTDWSAPVNIGPPINTKWDDNVPVLSKDEKTLFFTSTRPGGYGNEDIWVSKRQNKNAKWEEPVNLGPGVNTPYTDRMRSISRDGKIILFQSDRPNGGQGGTDIWAIVRKNPNDDLEWSQPVNLGPVINSGYNELAAKYLFDERQQNEKLFFSSGRPGGFGGPDIYESSIIDSGFATPMNVLELNSASFEVCFWVREDGREIVFTSNRPDLTGDSSLYDLWVSTRASVDESWSAPESLGSTVNAKDYLDANPMLASQNRALYFASSRPNSSGPAGNLDIYVSTRSPLAK